MTCLIGMAFWLIVGAVVGMLVGRYLRGKEP